MPLGAVMSPKRVLTVADHLGSVGGTESAQLEIFRGLARRGWEVHLLYVSRGDYWPQWDALAATTTKIGASLPSRSFLDQFPSERHAL